MEKWIKFYRKWQTVGAWLIVLVVLGSITAAVLLQGETPITPRYVKRCIVLLILLLAALVLVLILIRNALLVNTAFLIRLREQFMKTGKSIDSLEHELRKNDAMNGKVVTALNSLKDTIKQQENKT